MSKTRRKFVIGGEEVAPGDTADIRLPVSEMYTGETIYVPVRVIRAKKPGPALLLTAAVHGDEVNGTGIIRQFIFERPVELLSGSLVCVPVVNVFGFEARDRYMPDRRDLNRSFPGSSQGSLASRFAHTIMSQVVSRCDCCIDLHSAAETRTNFPNVRADLRQPAIKELAAAFGCELVVSGLGPEGSLRRAATKVGCPTIILEAGEVGKIEPMVVEIGVRGIRNVLVHLGMTEGQIEPPIYQTMVARTTWIRAELGGLLRFHVAPGDIIRAGQPIATNESVFGQARSILISHVDGIVLGMVTHPAVKPGEPVCHVALPGRRLSSIEKALRAARKESSYERVRDDLATNITVSALGRKRS